MVFGLSADEKAMKVLRAAMEALDLDVEEDDDSLSAVYEGDDMDVAFHAMAFKGNMQMTAILAVKVPPEREMDVLRAINDINVKDPFGAFRLHDNGMVSYDLSHMYLGTVPEQEVLENLVALVVGNADEADGIIEDAIEGL